MKEQPTFRVMAIHALAYCERLFYLEEVEEIRLADARVWAGRRLHQELDEPGEVVELTLESEELGLRGKIDAFRRRDGSCFPIEHKRGRCRRDADKRAAAWDSDRLQALAYAMLMEEKLGRSVTEARIRYHRDNLTVRVPLDDRGKEDVHAAVARAREVARMAQRPPVTAHESRCIRCSLAPVCLPEESRLAAVQGCTGAEEKPTPVRLYPPDQEKKSLHVTSHIARIGRSGACLSVVNGEERQVIAIRDVADVVIHGHAQISTQAMRLCALEEVPIHLVTQTGRYLAGLAIPVGSPQRRIRQYRVL